MKPQEQSDQRITIELTDLLNLIYRAAVQECERREFRPNKETLPETQLDLLQQFGAELQLGGERGAIAFEALATLLDGKMVGNGHHMAQQIVKNAEEILRTRKLVP